MKRLHLLSVSTLFLILFTSRVLAFEPQTITENPGRWDLWSVVPQCLPMCDAYDNRSILSYLDSGTNVIGGWQGMEEMSLSGEIPYGVPLPLSQISSAALVDDSGGVWIGSAECTWPRHGPSMENLYKLDTLAAHKPFYCWSNWLGMSQCDYRKGTFLVTFSADSSKDSMWVLLVVNTTCPNETLVQEIGPFKAPGTLPKVQMDHLYLPPLYDLPLGGTTSGVTVWWYGDLLDSLYVISISLDDYQDSTAVYPFVAENMVDYALSSWWVQQVDETTWRIIHNSEVIDVLQSDIEPQLYVPQYLSSDGDEIAAWTSHADSTGWKLNWLDFYGLVRSISSRHEILRVNIEFYNGGSGWWPWYPGYSYSGLDLYWSEFDSTRNVTTLYTLSEPSTDVDEYNLSVPTAFHLSAAYPNPFNSTTRVQIALPARDHVTIELFNVMGQRVSLIAEGVREAGVATIPIEAEGLASGVYFIRATTRSGITQSRRITLLR